MRLHPKNTRLRVKRNYETEIAELPATYQSVMNARIGGAVAAAVTGSRPMVFVGSGGALAVARLAADLHTRSTGELAVATTPLEAATAPLNPRVGVVLFSARGRHPDAALTISAARARGSEHLGVVTCRRREELPPALAAGDVKIATIEATADGFLATNSLLAMATAVCLGHDAWMPNVLPGTSSPMDRSIRDSCIVVTGPGTAAVGVDMEARLVETGLARVQLADYRNLAHGRHVGLLRNLENTTVVATIEPNSAELAERTLTLLPENADLVELRSELEWPASIIDLLVRSIRTTAAAGVAHGVDPGRPGVASFGRKLYHLPVTRLVALPQPGPVARKLVASGLGPEARPAIESALESWLGELRTTRLAGVVLDYDGTCCPTWDRFRPPPEVVQTEIIRLLDLGVAVGFATGRGRSILDDSRSWIPQEYWSSICVGLYNGSVLLRLDEDPPEDRACQGDLAEAAKRLDDFGWPTSVQIEQRRTQVSLSDSSGRLTGAAMLGLVQTLLSRAPELDCRAAASGHSVDVMASGPGKAAVVDEVRTRADGAVLAIGDQGALGGNDFDLLASTRLSLTVDRCSGDMTRCWNLDRHGRSGPDLLVRYLSAVQLSGNALKFRWPRK